MLNLPLQFCLLVLTQWKIPNAHLSEEEEEEKGKPENININPPSTPDLTISLIAKKEDDRDVLFIEIIKKYDDSHEEELEEDVNTMAGEMEVEYFDIFLTRSKLAYHKKDERNVRLCRELHYVIDFMIVKDISSIIDPRLSSSEMSNRTVQLTVRLRKRAQKPTRSQSRNNFPQQEASPAIFEPLRIELPFLEDQFPEDPLEDPTEVPMVDNRTMAELLQAPTEGYEDAIVIPNIAANNFELKHGLINLIQNKQFFRHDKEDPHAHIRYFNKITSTMRVLN
nr:reverse transcriptase domain-containing protein [Tanacetum cinerariifolium]